MKTIRFEDWKKERKAKLKIALEIENSIPDRLPGRRLRDPEKEKLLIKLEKARRQKMIDSGKLEIISPKHWIWHIDH